MAIHVELGLGSLSKPTLLVNTTSIIISLIVIIRLKAKIILRKDLERDR
jgi:hypothetical protein